MLLSMLAWMAAAPTNPIEVRWVASADTTLFADAPNHAHGAGSGLFIGNIASGAPRRSLLLFDVSSLPADVTVLEASLTLYVDRAGIASSNADLASLHRLTESWSEGSADGGTGGAGTPGEAGDTTWVWRSLGGAAQTVPGVPWRAEGGTFAPVSSAIAELPSKGVLTFSTTPGLVADVQGWIERPGSNFGWILLGNEQRDQTARRILSRESVATGLRPELRVRYVTSPGGPGCCSDSLAQRFAEGLLEYAGTKGPGFTMLLPSENALGAAGNDFVRALLMHPEVRSRWFSQHLLLRKPVDPLLPTGDYETALGSTLRVDSVGGESWVGGVRVSEPLDSPGPHLVRRLEGLLVPPPPRPIRLAAVRADSDVLLNWEGGLGPYTLQRHSLGGSWGGASGWVDLATLFDRSERIVTVAGSGTAYRIMDRMRFGAFLSPAPVGGPEPVVATSEAVGRMDLDGESLSWTFEVNRLPHGTWDLVLAVASNGSDGVLRLSSFDPGSSGGNLIRGDLNLAATTGKAWVAALAEGNVWVRMTPRASSVPGLQGRIQPLDRIAR
jgi:hypothetical protein